MITALISTVMGMVGGVLPDIVKEFRDGRNHSRELEHMERQAKLQLEVAKAGHDSRLREIEANAYVQESVAFREQMKTLIESQSRPTGVAWVDAFNALLRPVCVTLIIALFMLTALPFTWALIEQFRAGQMDATAFANAVWGSLVGESILATLGYLFGYRSAAKK